MIVALIDNGSVEPAAHRELRALARTLGRRTDTTVHAVSWKHSHRIPEAELDGVPAWTLAPFIRSLVALGQRDFVFVPFFVSPQGAIGSSLRRELEALQAELGRFEFSFTEGLVDRGVLADIVADHVRATIAARQLDRSTPVVVVDHGGPSATSAQVRDRIARDVGRRLTGVADFVTAASMEGEEHPHNRPLLAEVLARCDRPDVMIAPLFLLPGRHAGPGGDLAQIARAAEERGDLRCHFTALIGAHPRAIAALAEALRETLSHLHLSTLP